MLLGRDPIGAAVQHGFRFFNNNYLNFDDSGLKINGPPLSDRGRFNRPKWFASTL